jgi:hypothetical protein
MLCAARVSRFVFRAPENLGRELFGKWKICKKKTIFFPTKLSMGRW